MSTFSRQRKYRLRDFETRARHEREVRHYRGWRYITVHPFADELELLQPLSLTPDLCKQADVWWHTGEDIVLLQTCAGGTQSSISYRYFGDPPYLSINAQLLTPTTTIVQLHKLMDRIAKHGLPQRCRTRQTRKLLMT